MVIKQFYSPSVAGDNSGEAMLFKRGLGILFDEIRQSVLQSHLIISPRKTVTKTPGVTGNPGLAEAMNKSLKCSLESLGWGPKTAPGASGLGAKIDWYKSIKSGISYGPQEVGLGLEIQFGNNFQFDADLKRLHEAILDNLIVAGICIVASDELALYKADRGAYFSEEKRKLDRYLTISSASGAAIIPSYVMIGVQQDGFNSDLNGKFTLTSPKFKNNNIQDFDPVDFSTLV